MEIYLDNAATTRCDEEAAALALEVMTQDYGNPSSLHKKGINAQMRLDRARAQLANALGGAPEEVIFTGSGTEANNIAIFGAVEAKKRRGNKIVGMATAHSSVREPLEYLEKQGYAVELVGPLPDGNTDIDAVLAAVDDQTILLCLEMVGSEVGAVTPVAEIARRARRRNSGLVVHCDAVQGLGKVLFSAAKLGVDTLSVSGHKIFAPKGCGALYVRKGVRLVPHLHGGGQERNLRPGTESVPLAAAFGLAAEKAVGQYEERLGTVRQIYEHFVNKAENEPRICINSPADSTPYISNLSVPGFRSETLLHFLAGKGIYVSSGSACSKGAPSHVLTAMGLPPARIDSALRISLSPHNSAEEIDRFFEALGEGINTLVGSGSGR